MKKIEQPSETLLTQEEMRDLIARAQSGDDDARKKMIEGNTRLVWSIVQRFSSRGVELDDLFQIGCIGLMKSVDKFDLKYEVKFSTYAVPMIIGEIQRFLRDDGMVKVSRSQLLPIQRRPSPACAHCHWFRFSEKGCLP